MRQSIKDFVRLCSETLPILEPIYEFGSFQVAGIEDLANLRSLFPDSQYVGTDMREGPGVDMILDLHKIDLPDNSVGVALILDTLEHVEFPHTAMAEVYRVLKPNGLTIISSVMDYPIHEYPYDYWRFTPEAFKSILSPFESSFVGWAGFEIFPHTVVAIGFKGSQPSLEEFKAQFPTWQQKWKPEVNPEPYVNYTTMMYLYQQLVGNYQLLLQEKERLAAQPQLAQSLLQELQTVHNTQQLEFQTKSLDSQNKYVDLQSKYLELQIKYNEMEKWSQQLQQNYQILEGWAKEVQDRLQKTQANNLYRAITSLQTNFRQPQKWLSAFSSNNVKASQSDQQEYYQDYKKKTLHDWLVYHQKEIAFDQCRWMGIPTLKNPLDAWIYQEIIYETKPDIIIEIGSYNGGSTLYLANLLDLIGKGSVISIDLSRQYYQVESHPRIILVTGISSSPEIISQVQNLCGDKTVLLIHDGDHNKAQVLKDLQAYAKLVTLNSYLIVEDGIVDVFEPEEMNWAANAQGPLIAIEQFLGENDNFIRDKERERYLITYNPKGYLKRIK
jgi:cephalosporin hydroxylase